MNPYDVVAYDGSARASSHPGRLLATARLLGRRVPDAEHIRVLELGCGHGSNLLPMALDMAGASFVGVDLAAAPIDRARQSSREVGVSNVEFVQADLRDLPHEVGQQFDVIIAHGVYSWVPLDARDALMRVVSERLAPDGLAFISYNTYPGSYARDAIRDALEYSVGTVEDATERIAAARDLLTMLAMTGGAGEHGQAVASYARQLLERPDWLLFHDELAPICQPVYLHEFVDHAKDHGLAYLFEAHLSHGLFGGLRPELAAHLDALGGDVVRREQHVDFLVNRLFRESVVVHGDVAEHRTVDAAAALDLHVQGALINVDGLRFGTADRTEVTVADERVAEVLRLIGAAYPASVPVRDLGVDADGPAIRTIVDLHIHGHVELLGTPLRATSADVERPHVDELVRWQVRRGRDRVTSATHRDVGLEDEDARRMLLLLDGTRDRAAIVADMGLEDGVAVEDALLRLASVSLLTTPR